MLHLFFSGKEFRIKKLKIFYGEIPLVAFWNLSYCTVLQLSSLISINFSTLLKHYYNLTQRNMHDIIK